MNTNQSVTIEFHQLRMVYIASYPAMLCMKFSSVNTSEYVTFI